MNEKVGWLCGLTSIPFDLHEPTFGAASNLDAAQ